MKTVGIVGRTNVGKSTIFNRLVKQNKSIISDVAGTTRDYITGEIIVSGNSYQLVDFGGFDFDTQEIVERNVQKNILENIKQLDLILFVVDGRCVLSEEDRKIAELLRKLKKPVILVINKVDGKKQEEDIYDYFSLGFEDVVPISAINNRGLDTLTIKISERLKLRKSKKHSILKNRSTKIAIIGKPNVGKSSLFNVFCEGERSIVTEIAGTTRDSIDSEVVLGKTKYIFVDTAGLKRKTRTKQGLDRESSYRSIRAINDADIILYILDVNNYATNYDFKLLEYSWKKGKPIILVVNKWDIKPRDMTENKYKEILVADNSIFKYFPLVPVSAVKNIGIDRLVEEIKRIEKKIPFEIKTSVLNKEIRKIILEIGGVNQKFYYGTQTSSNPVRLLLFVNDKKYFTKKYTVFIEKKLRENFDLLGVPIFIDLREKVGKE